MRREDFHEGSPGDLVEISDRFGRVGIAFDPHDLPPILELGTEIWGLAESAAYTLGNLNGLGSRLPNPSIIAMPFARKEALASSRIEGTRAEFGQLALFEADFGESSDDVSEVSNYVRALEAAWDSPVTPISITGIRALHEILLRGVRGDDALPGQFRAAPVMIGSRGDTLQTARFVPTPPERVSEKMSNLVDFARGRSWIPRLVQLAIIHYQFETIHPFNDGNGRVGRLLIPLQLHAWGLLDYQLLYISEYFERYRDEYIDSLFRVSTAGDWEGWIRLFLNAIESQANDATERATSLLDLRERMRAHYQLRGKPRTLPIIDELFARATMTFGLAHELTGLGKQASNTLIRGLVEDGVLIEMTGRQRNQIFFAPDIARASMGLNDPHDAR